jgi:xylan 1,4-beta-xylosidase
MEILHQLGDQRLENNNADVLVTKANDGSLVVAVWNIVNPGSTGAAKTVKLEFKGVKPDAQVSMQRVDESHGNTLGLWEKMGSPRYPSQQQLTELREKSRLSQPEASQLRGGTLTLDLPVNGLAVLTVK